MYREIQGIRDYINKFNILRLHLRLLRGDHGGDVSGLLRGERVQDVAAAAVTTHLAHITQGVVYESLQTRVAQGSVGDAFTD